METLITLAIAAVVGMLGGTHTAIWGMYNDAQYEGFVLTRFPRSIVLGGIAAVVVQAVLRLDLRHPSALFVLFGLAYAAERATWEVWKTFVRQENQAKYTIPMQFSIGGVPVTSRRARLAAGLAYVAAVVAVFMMLAQVDIAEHPLAAMTQAALLGFAAGTIVAIGGCWKDAPKEGFDLLKFFRSPIMATLYAMVLSLLTDSALQIAAAAIGFERATAETYKTFLRPSRARGKFAGKPILHPEMLQRRRRFVPAYVVISVATVVCMFFAVGLA